MFNTSFSTSSFLSDSLFPLRRRDSLPKDIEKQTQPFIYRDQGQTVASEATAAPCRPEFAVDLLHHNNQLQGAQSHANPPKLNQTTSPPPLQDPEGATTEAEIRP